jgi:excinuclease Cho
MPEPATGLPSHQISSENLAELPHAPGVYVFHGEGALPLYIGKSVDIRTRVLSHLRNPEEARMLAQTRRVDFIRTAGELGALLLESQMIKTHSPLFNVRLRRIRSLCSIQLKPNPVLTGLIPEIVDAKSVALGVTPGLHGLYSSRHAAKESLRALAKAHALCLVALGLEKPSPRGCFGLQINACLGCCVGREDRASHDARLASALSASAIHTWPYSGAIDIVEQDQDWMQKHRIHNWAYLGTWCSQKQDALAHNTATGFDMDTYKILIKPLLLGHMTIEQVHSK